MILQNISLNTSVDVIRVPKARTSENSYKFYKYLSTECGEISSEVRENKTLNIITPHAQCERGKVINCGVHIYI